MAIMNTPPNETSRRGHGLGLLGILAGIVLGVCCGVFYGRAMWLASGGPDRELQRLRQTVKQKLVLADQAEAAGDRKEADRLRSHVPVLQEAIRKTGRDKLEADRLLFHVGLSFQEDLESGILSEEFRREFENHNAPLAEKVTVRWEEPAGVWRISDGERTYLIRKVAEPEASLGIYVEKVLPRVISQLTRFCGDIFLRMLMLIVIPLVVTSMICGITSLGDIRQMGKVGGWTMFYYVSTCAAAVVLGILLVTIIRPGAETDDTFAYVSESVIEKQDTTVLGTLLEVVRGREGDEGSGMIPSNIFLAASQSNVLGLILFCLVFGGALTTLGQRGKPAISFFQAANDAVMKVVRLIIYFTPVGVFGLIATQIADSGGGREFYGELIRLGWFVTTVTVGLAIHLVVLCIVLAVFARRNPLEYIYLLARALLTALSTDSSSATLPVTIECVEESGVSERAADFVLPLGATINMDGTALYEAVAAIFIAQSVGLHLGGPALVIVFLTATLAAIGAPGIPSAGLVTLLIVLTAVGLPAAGIGTILAIDWFLDRQRTSINVFGDAVGAAVIDRYFGRDTA
jgi:Na+/H+-dicarboxylate symporter